MKKVLLLKRTLLALLIVAAVVILVRWRIGVVHEAGRAFAEDRLDAISDNAETFMRAWRDDKSGLAERVGRAFEAGGERSRGARPGAGAILQVLLEDREIVSLHLADSAGVSLSSGTSALADTEIVRLTREALAADTAVTGILTARGDTLRIPLAVPFCAAHAAGPGADCSVVLLEIDPRPGLIDGLRGMQGAGRTSRYVVVLTTGEIVPISRTEPAGGIDPVQASHDLPVAVLDSAKHAARSFYERENAAGATIYGVARRVDALGFGLLREATREEVMANHERQLELEATLAVTALVLIALGWFGYDRTIGAVRARRMAAAEARLATVVRTATDAILIVDDSSVIEVANDSAAQLLGVAPTDLVGARLDQWLDADSALAIAQMHRSLEHDSLGYARLAPETGFRIVRRDGAVRSCEASISPTGSHIPRSYALIIRDVTSRKGLEDRVRQSERLAAVSRLVGGVAHELNNPLAIISLTSELMSERATEGEDLEDLRTMRQAAHRAGRIVRDLLHYIEEYPLKYGPVQVAQLLDDVEREVRPLLDMMGVELQLQPVASDLLVHADAAALRQALDNLIINGSQAAGAGGRVRVGVHDHDGTVQLRVSDGGPGVPEHLEQKIFEPFFTTKGVGEGAGLGLSVSLAIISQHQGTLVLERGRGPGASFLVTLPLMDKAA